MPFAAAILDLFASAVADDVSYIPVATGAPLADPVRAIKVKSGGGADGFLSANVDLSGHAFEVQRSQVVQPAPGDLLVWHGQTFVVRKRSLEPTLGLVWVLAVDEAE